MPSSIRVTTVTTVTLTGPLTVEALQTALEELPPKAVVTLTTVNPDRPGEMSATTIRVTH